MIANGFLRLIVVASPLVLAACATPRAAAPATPATASTPASPGSARVDHNAAPPGQRRAKWSKATEAEVAATLDRKFQAAAKSFVKLKRDDQVMFCKRYRDIGSMIPQLHCITEAELRKQVEDSDELRDQVRRRVGKCALGPGCAAGPDPIPKIPIPQ